MKAAPIGAFGAMAFTIGKYGIGTLANLAALVGTFYLTSLLFVLVVLGAVAPLQRLLDPGADPLPQGRAAAGARHLVVGSGAARLMEKMERAGCQAPVVGLVVPTGYSFNLDGTNIYMTLAALFIAQATGIALTLGDQILLLLVAMLSSKGAAGVTGAGFITLGRDALGRAVGAGRRHGADPRRRPLHERMPSADQLHRQRGRDHRRRALGRRARHDAFRRRDEWQPRQRARVLRPGAAGGMKRHE